MTQLENHMSQPCLTVGMYKIFENLYFVDNKVEVRCRRKVVDCAYIICRQVGPLSFGCTTSAPDVSSPRVYGRVLVGDYRLQFLLLLSLEFFLKTTFLSGARPALPMGVAPEAIAKKIRV
jgi:hypothetical protein